MNKRTMIVATGNKGKLSEINDLLLDYDFIIRSLVDYPEIGDIEENGKSFAENAMLKAETVWNVTRSWVLADDSGLEVDYLNGAPGIYSARYAGEEKNDKENNHKLLEALKGVSFAKRGAAFRCVLALIEPNGKKLLFEGVCYGKIAETEKGKGGFGYDPLFFLPTHNQTMAELPEKEKNIISHRAKAMEKLVNYIRHHR